MIPIIKIKPWVVINGVQHTSTSWRIATDQAMTNIIEEVLDDPVNIDVYYSKITMPVNTTYYVSVKRGYTDSTGLTSSSAWTDGYPISNDITDVGVITELDIVIDKPYVYLDKAAITDSTVSTITINTSIFRGIGDGHGYTSYLIYDGIKLVGSYLKDSVNLTSITINKSDIGYDYIHNLVVKVIHGTLTGVESPVGSANVVLVKSNFVIDSNLTRVLPYVTNEILFSKVDATQPLGITRISILPQDESSVLYTTQVTGESLRYVLPTRLFGPNSSYVLAIKSTDGSNVVEFKYPISTITNLNSYNIQYDYVYNNTLVYDRPETTNLIESGVIYTTLSNGKALGYDKGTNTVSMYDIDATTKVPVNPVPINGLTALVTTGNSDSYIEFRDDNHILLDVLDATGVPTFLLYKYNWVDNSAVLVGTLSRPTETKSVGYGNSIVRTGVDTYLYIATGSNVITELNTLTMTITTKYTIPNNTSLYNNIFPAGGDKYNIITGDATVLLYDLTRGDTVPGLTLPPEFRTRELRVNSLINGDTVITTKTPVTGDTNSVLHYELANSVMTEIAITSAGLVNYTSSILLSSGDLLLVDTVTSATTDDYYIYN